MAGEVTRYLETGRYDPSYAAWPGQNFLESAERGHRELLDALVAEVHRRARRVDAPPPLPELDLVAFTRAKVAPMVRGLFPKTEQDAVLALLERSVVFVGPDNVEAVIREQSRWLHTAWDLANLYLASIGAETLDGDPGAPLGIGQHTTCFVSLEYFAEQAPFEDFVVHEAAHVFHNCKRRTAGLPETRRREWLLDIEFGKRETFAYACEAYSRVLERAPRARDRLAIARELPSNFASGDDRVDSDELRDIVAEAATRRNGWKVIHGRCKSTF
jgi:hypothetical protein